MNTAPLDRRSRLLLAAAALLFLTLATANAGGYRYGVSDQAFYVPAIDMTIDASLFPRDRAVLGPQMQLWVGNLPIAWATELAGGDMPAAFAIFYVATLLVLFGAGVALARSLGCSWWGLAAFLALVTLRHRITKTGANSLEGYMHPRALAFALGTVAFACIARGRMWHAAFWTAGAAVIHTTTALWFGIVVAVAVIWSSRYRRTGLIAAGAAGVGALVALLGPLASHVATIDAPWRAVIAGKDYLFPLGWPAYAWALNLAYAVVLVLVCRRRRARGVAPAGEAALVAGLVSLVAVFLLSVPLTASAMALAVQLQVNRVFWLLDFVVALYAGWWLADDLGARWPRLARTAVVATLVLASAVRGFYVLQLETHRSLVDLRLPATAWTEAMTWIRQQPNRWLVLADPGHAWKFGSSVRTAAARDTLLEDTKDSAFAIYDRGVALAVAERGRALADFDGFTAADVRALDARYQVDVFIDRSTRAFDLPVLYRNDQFVVYDLR